MFFLKKKNKFDFDMYLPAQNGHVLKKLNQWKKTSWFFMAIKQ
jgi:hypothetical protein